VRCHLQETYKNFIVKTYFYRGSSQLFSAVLVAVVLFVSAFTVRQFHSYGLKEQKEGPLVEEQKDETPALLPGISIGFEIH
jgi:hypothetical protein